MPMMRFIKTHNKKPIAVLLALLTTAPLLFSSCSAGDGSVIPEDSGEWKIKNQISANEKICFDFFEREMVNADGGIRTNYLDEEKNEGFAAGGEVLSESLGLMMLYAVGTGDESLFDSSLAFVKEHLDTGEIFSYRYDEGGQAYHVNAFVDDMRIIRALILADDVFGRGLAEESVGYAKRLYGTNVKDDLVFDLYDDQYDTANGSITLCYIDLYTMKLLEGHDRKWGEVYGSMLAIARGGYLSDEFPMFAGSYDYAAQTYGRDTVNMIESLLTVLNLAMVDQCPGASIDFLRHGLKKGKIYAYYSREGVKASDMESTAVYALCSLIAKEIGDEQMYEMGIEKMIRFQVLDKKSEVYGAFADPRTLELYSFDNLMALLAMR